MSKVVRLSDYTEKLLEEYSKITKNKLESYNFDYKTLIRSEDQLIQAALLRVIKEEDHLL